LNVEAANADNGAQTEISTYQGVTQQQFLIDPQSDGTYRIRTTLDGNLLNAVKPSPSRMMIVRDSYRSTAFEFAQ
jgi:hypothetical protein